MEILTLFVIKGAHFISLFSAALKLNIVLKLFVLLVGMLDTVYGGRQISL